MSWECDSVKIGGLGSPSLTITIKAPAAHDDDDACVTPAHRFQHDG